MRDVDLLRELDAAYRAREHLELREERGTAAKRLMATGYVNENAFISLTTLTDTAPVLAAKKGEYPLTPRGYEVISRGIWDRLRDARAGHGVRTVVAIITVIATLAGGILAVIRLLEFL